jgi:hypothetical protein
MRHFLVRILFFLLKYIILPLVYGHTVIKKYERILPYIYMDILPYMYPHILYLP